MTGTATGTGGSTGGGTGGSTERHTATQAVVLVEGVSDRVALETVARRRGMDLEADGVAVVAMDGITNVSRFLAHYRANEPHTQITGLYDEAEESFVRRSLELIGHDVAPDCARTSLEALGFFSCSADLEDELIRALGPREVERLVEAEGQLRSFRKLQQQPALRDWSVHDQLRRMMSGRSGAKERYAAVMARALPLDRVPRPLSEVLAYVSAEQRR
ncbi:MAG: TOPRIM nucleotidyl transferase/hydrolase domain-containing protein [Actinocrinis sp.]